MDLPKVSAPCSTGVLCRIVVLTCQRTLLAAVFGITSGAADFLGPSGIRVVSISPASVASKMTGDRGVSLLRNLTAS